MTFLGKKFRRVRCDNIEEFCKVTKTAENLVRILNGSATLSYSRNEDGTLTFSMESGESVLNSTFTLGEEADITRRDGSKVKMTYTMEGDNILNNTILQPDGKIVLFRREFSDNDMKMRISMEGYDVTASIYYEKLQ